MAVAAGAQGRAVRNGDYIAAVVNQELVTAGEVERRIERAQADASRAGMRLPPESELRRQALDALIDERAMITTARESGMRVDDAEVDRAGHRIAVGRGSAYDLYLRRELKAATLVQAPTSPAVTDLFLAQNLEVAAGVKQQLQADAQRLPGLRLLDGRFMVIEQAMGVPKGRLVAQRWLSHYIEDMKASGFVAQALARHGIQGAAVAPPQARP